MFQPNGISPYVEDRRSKPVVLLQGWLTLLGTMLGLFPVLLGGTPEQAARFFAPFVAGHGAPLDAFAAG